MVDLAAAEKTEQQLDAFIGKRTWTAQAERERTVEEMYAESMRRYYIRRRRENRAAWYAYHLDMAERIERTAAVLAKEHRAQAEALLEEPKGER